MGSRCFDCVHKNDVFGKNPMGCKAFPKRIPHEILSSEVGHTKPLKGQKNKIVYKKKSAK